MLKEETVYKLKVVGIQVKIFNIDKSKYIIVFGLLNISLMTLMMAWMEAENKWMVIKLFPFSKP